jgi:hypothetical protein
MSEYTDDAIARQNYGDLVSGVRRIRKAAQEAFGPLAAMPIPERSTLTFQDCEQIADAITRYATDTTRRIAELEKQVALTSRVEIEGVTEDAPPLACD